jgi:hypothetical protein
MIGLRIALAGWLGGFGMLVGFLVGRLLADPDQDQFMYGMVGWLIAQISASITLGLARSRILAFAAAALGISFLVVASAAEQAAGFGWPAYVAYLTVYLIGMTAYFLLMLRRRF